MASCMTTGDKGYIVASLVRGIFPSKVTATYPADKKASPVQVSLSTVSGPHVDINTLLIHNMVRTGTLYVLMRIAYSGVIS